jgi:hypothetical protein
MFVKLLGVGRVDAYSWFVVNTSQYLNGGDQMYNVRDVRDVGDLEQLFKDDRQYYIVDPAGNPTFVPPAVSLPDREPPYGAVAVLCYVAASKTFVNYRLLDGKWTSSPDYTDEADIARLPLASAGSAERLEFPEGRVPKLYLLQRMEPPPLPRQIPGRVGRGCLSHSPEM